VPVLAIELMTTPQVGDRLSLILFGSGHAIDDPLQSLLRTFEISVEDAFVEILPADLNLLDATTLNGAALADGPITIAVRYERGSVMTPVQIADGDALLPGLQPLILDVTPPQLVGMGPSGDLLDSLRSDQRGVVLSARANEDIRRAIVRMPGSGFDNGEDAGVASSNEAGLFVTLPVRDGSGDPLNFLTVPTLYSLEIYDRALNPATVSIGGTFTQIGAVGPNPVIPGDPISVHAYDALTFAPLAGVRVISDRDLGGVVDRIGLGTTNASGNALVTSAPSGTTILSLALEEYDLFTFHGLDSRRIQVPLMPSGTLEARSTGEVVAQLPDADVEDSTGHVGDSRVPPGDERLFPVGGCDTDAVESVLRCAYGPEGVLPGWLGAQSFLATDESVTFATFSAAAFLEAFALKLPLTPLSSNQTESSDIRLDFLLSDLVPADQAVAGPDQVLDEPPRVEPDGFGLVTGDPVITVETVSPGIHGSIPVGRGLAFDDMLGSWDLRSAYGGQARGGADPGGWGALVTAGTLESDLYLRAELTDDAGARHTLAHHEDAAHVRKRR
jgi:hypothetical protein